MNPNLALLAAVPAIAIVMQGCATTSGVRSLDTATSSMADIESQLDQGEARLNAVLAAMDALETAEDLDRAYRNYERAIRDLEQSAERVRARRIAMESRAADHASRWRTESANLSGATAQEISEQRLQEFEASVNNVSASIAELRGAYDPFISKLKDLRLVLANDLSRPGVDRTRPIRAGITELSTPLRHATDKARLALETARADFAR